MSSSALQAALPHPDLGEITKLGLIAGEGAFPFLVARAARDFSIPVTAFGVRGITSSDLEAEVETIHWMEIGQFGRLIRTCHAEGISNAVMCGRVKHSSIFQLTRIDGRGLKMLAKMVNKKANSILGVVTQELERENIHVLDSTLFLRSFMPGKGLLTSLRPPNSDVRKDIEFGHELAKQIAGLDVGQTVVVKGLSVVAVEAMEGTDAAILRGGQIAGPGVVVVKVSKPQQDKRFDVPVFGITTIQKMIEVKAAALAFSADETLFFDQAEAVDLAQSHKITLIGV